MNKDAEIMNLKTEDFEGNTDEAKKWAEEQFKDWKNSLTEEQKAILADSDRVHDLNVNLQKYHNTPDKLSKADQRAIEELDTSLREASARIPEPMYVYKNMSAEEVGFPEGYFYTDNPKTIDEKKAENFSVLFKYGAINDFMKIDLSTHVDNSSPILFHFVCPNGTSMGYLNEDQIILNRNQGLEVTGMSIITMDGRELIRIDGKLISKDEILKEVKQVQNDVNNKFKELVKTDAQLVDLQVDGLYASIVVTRVENLIKQVSSRIPNDQLILCFRKMTADGALLLTDSSLMNFGAPNDRVLGFYNPNKGYVAIDISHFGHTDEIVPLIDTVMHELGHAFDDLLFAKDGTLASESVAFKAIYEAEKNNITDDIYIPVYIKYITSTSKEFFAAIFACLYSPDPRIVELIEKEAPEACAFIRNLMEMSLQASNHVRFRNAKSLYD